MIKLAKKQLLRKLIGCEAQEGFESKLQNGYEDHLTSSPATRRSNLDLKESNKYNLFYVLGDI